MSRIAYSSAIPSKCTNPPVPATVEDLKHVALHIQHKLQAGFPSPAADYTAEPLDLNRYLIDRVSCTFLFDVEGWSMMLAGIYPGDKVVVDRSIEARPGHIIVAIVNDEFTIKRLLEIGGRYELHPENPDFKPIRFEEGEVLQAFGVVTGIVRKLAL